MGFGLRVSEFGSGVVEPLDVSAGAGDVCYVSLMLGPIGPYLGGISGV